MKDEILEELWKTKDDIAKECNYDIQKLFQNLKDKPED